MIVRWRRRSSGRLSARLVHNQRVGGRVRQHHVAELGAISPARLDPADTVEGIVARRAFWRTADAALARFSDRIDASLDETIRAALQSRVPVVTPNELRRVSLLKAEREQRFWGTMVEVSQRNGQEDRSADPLQLRRDQLFQGFAKHRVWTLRHGGIVDRERGITPEEMRKALMDHGINPVYAPPRKAIEELSDAEFEAMLERCVNKTQPAI